MVFLTVSSVGSLNLPSSPGGRSRVGCADAERDCSAAARAVAFPKASNQLAEDTRKAHTGLQLACCEGRRSESPLRWLTQISRTDRALG